MSCGIVQNELQNIKSITGLYMIQGLSIVNLKSFKSKEEKNILPFWSREDGTFPCAQCTRTARMRWR